MQKEPKWKVTICGVGWRDTILCEDELQVSDEIKKKLADYIDICVKIEPIKKLEDDNMKWCNVMNMWCSDMDEEDKENCGCDGECSGCEESEDV